MSPRITPLARVECALDKMADLSNSLATIRPFVTAVEWELLDTAGDDLELARIDLERELVSRLGGDIQLITLLHV